MSNVAASSLGANANAHPAGRGVTPLPNEVDGHRPASAVSGKHGAVAVILRAIDLVWEWRERTRGRRQLASMPDHLLKDVGLTSLDAERECSKPFWIG